VRSLRTLSLGLTVSAVQLPERPTEQRLTERELAELRRAVTRRHRKRWFRWTAPQHPKMLRASIAIEARDTEADSVVVLVRIT
jgi:hypothetical protein